jgi:hypothetical protein
MKGLSAKYQKMEFPGIIFARKSLGLGPRAVDHARPRSTMDRPWTAAPSSASGRSGVQGHGPRGGRGGVGRGELGGPLTGAREAVRRPGDGGEDGGGQNSGAERARARGARKWGRG